MIKNIGYITCGLAAAIAFLHLPAGCHLLCRYNQHLERRIDEAFEKKPAFTPADELANDLELLKSAKQSPWRRMESTYLRQVK